MAYQIRVPLHQHYTNIIFYISECNLFCCFPLPVNFQVLLLFLKTTLVTCSISFSFQNDYFIHKFLHSGIPQYFGPYLQPYRGGYNTRRSKKESTSQYLGLKHLFTDLQSSLPLVLLMMPELCGMRSVLCQEFFEES